MVEQTTRKHIVINIVGNSGIVGLGCEVRVGVLGGEGEGVGGELGLCDVEGVGVDVMVVVSVGVAGGEGDGI